MTLDDYLDVAHDLVAVLPLRLRRPVRRSHRGDRRRADTRAGPAQAAGAASRRSAPRCTAARRGTSSTISRRWRCATPARSCGRAPISRRPTSTSPSCTTASASSRCAGSRRSGFCGKGEGGPFVEGGARIARDGVLPLNTHGGQLSSGRLHGYGFLHEACVQLWGEGGERQVRPGRPRGGGRRRRRRTARRLPAAHKGVTPWRHVLVRRARVDDGQRMGAGQGSASRRATSNARVALIDEAAARTREPADLFDRMDHVAVVVHRRELGEPAVERALRTTGDDFITRAAQGTWGDLPADGPSEGDRARHGRRTAARARSTRTTRRSCCRSGAEAAAD